MAPVVSWTLLALAAALVVIVVGAVAAGGTQGVRQFVVDLRAGLRREHRDGPGVLDDFRALAEEDGASVDDLFSLGTSSDTPAYLDADPSLHRERLGHVVGRVSKVVPRPHRTVGGRPADARVASDSRG